MTKIAIKRQKIFAEYAGITGSIAQFGSMAVAAKAYSNDLDTIQGLAGWTGGFGQAVIANGPPALEDMNAIFYALTKQLAYLYQAGISEWNASPTYYIGSLVNNALDTIFMSGIDDNTNNALTDSAKWINFISKKMTLITTTGQLPYTVLADDCNIVCSATPTTDNKTVTLPAPSVGNIGRLVRIKQTGAITTNNLSVSVSGGSTIDGGTTSTLAQYTCKKFVSNGTNWYLM